MRWFDQVILVVYTVCLAVLSAVIVLVAAGWWAPLEVLREALTTANGRWLTGIVAALFFVSSIRLLYFAFRPRGPGETLVRATNHGDVQIALAAVENLIRRVGRQVEGVRELRARVGAAEEGIAVRLRATVATHVNVPDLTDQLEDTVRRQVRQVVGVDVQRVRTLVEDIGGGEGRRRRVG